MCDEYFLHKSLKTKTVLCQADRFFQCNFGKKELKEDLLDVYQHNFDSDTISSIKALSALFAISGKV